MAFPQKKGNRKNPAVAAVEYPDVAGVRFLRMRLSGTKLVDRAIVIALQPGKNV